MKESKKQKRGKRKRNLFAFIAPIAALIVGPAWFTELSPQLADNMNYNILKLAKVLLVTKLVM